MNTPSHILLHIGLRKYVNKKTKFHIPKSFVFGALAPDLGLLICIIIYSLYSTYIIGNTQSITFERMFDVLYFTDPFWIFAYNILHSPLMLGIFIGGIFVFRKKLTDTYTIFLWFFLGCLLHSFFDIPLHHDDGPRIFYPLSNYVFHSPFSYWDKNHYANYIMPIEFICNIFLIIYILHSPIKNKILGKK